MIPNANRSYNCKNEELPVICKFSAFSLKRDLLDFTAYSPRFTEAYITDFETKITTTIDLIEPKSETVELKTITERLHNTIDGLVGPANYLTGYINMADKQQIISASDFGIASLRKGISSKDVENVIKSLHTVNANVVKYKALLTDQGLKEELITRFVNDAVSIAADKQSQYEIISNRRNIVQNNTGTFNLLYDQLSEIMATGKILYKGIDAAKLQDYTFTELKKRVRKTKSPAAPANGTIEETEPNNVS